MITELVEEIIPNVYTREVKALPDYRLWLHYTDGVEGEVDLSHLAGRGVFAAWDDYQVFEKVHIGASGAISWNDDIELCPDALYLRLQERSPKRYSRN